MFTEIIFLLTIQLLKIDGSCIYSLPQIGVSTSAISQEISTDGNQIAITTSMRCPFGYIMSNKAGFTFNAHGVIFDYNEDVIECVKIIDYCLKIIGLCKGIYNYTNSKGCVCVPCYIAPSTSTQSQDTTIEKYNPFEIDVLKCPPGYMIMNENVNPFLVKIDMLKCPPGFMVMDDNKNKFVVETVLENVLYTCMSFGHYCRKYMSNLLPSDCLHVKYTITNMGGYLDRMIQCECDLMYS
jgi:hypothetical protein